MAKEKQSEEKKLGITRRDFVKGIAVGAVATAAVSAGVVAVSWPAAPPAPPGVVTKTETVTRTTTAAATTVTATTTAPPVTTTATTTLPAVTTTVTAAAPPPAVAPAYTKKITLNVNGLDYTLEVENRTTLLDALRKGLGLTGTKWSCNLTECGACTVLMDGKPILSCGKLAIEAEGKKILTIEGLAEGEKLHPLQEAFIDPEHYGFQCGYCAPGMLLTAKGLLDRKPSPTELEVREAIAGNLCKCGNYNFQVAAILAAAKKMGGR